MLLPIWSDGKTMTNFVEVALTPFYDYGLSIYRGYIWYDSAHCTTITMTLVQVIVWFRQAASHYPSQCRQIYAAILCHNVLSTCQNINGDSRIIDPFVRGNHWWDVVLTKKSVIWNFCVCFVVSLNNLLGKQSSCPWLKTLWNQCHFTVLLLDNFKML